jgi:hypothetical protein
VKKTSAAPRYNSPTKPMKHQKLALHASDQKPPTPSSEDVFAYLMEQGTGKSKVLLDEWGEGTMNGGPLDLLITAPSGSIRNWYEDKSEIQRSELNVHLDKGLRERMMVAAWDKNTARGRDVLAHMLRTQDPSRPRALFVNIEALSTDTGAREVCMEFLQQRIGYMGVDESTRIKGHKSNRTKTVWAIGQEAATRRILTGLVSPRSPMDLYAQFYFLDWKIIGQRNYHSYLRRYAVLKRQSFGGRTFDQIVGYQNLEELGERIRPYSYRVLKKDCLDLEEKTYSIRDVEQTPEQRRIYKELRANATATIGDSHVTTTMVIQQMMRMHTVNMGFVKDEVGETHEIPELRTRAMMEELEEHNGKAIIWAPFDFAIRRVIDTLKKEYGPNSVAAFWGGNTKTRGADEKRFLGDPECRFMVSTPAAGGWGNTWTVADLEIYYGNDYDLEKRSQSEDRAHRKGQKNRVRIVDLIARGTVDEKMVAALRKKIDMATLITGEGYRKWLI